MSPRPAEWLGLPAGILAAVIAAVVLAAPPEALAGERRAKHDLQLERTPVIVRNSYRDLPKIGPEGQMGANLRGGFSLSHQQYGDIYVRAGLVRGKPRLIKRGFRAFDYAFRRQRDNGSFPEDQPEGYAFFVEAVAHSVLLVRASRWEEGSIGAWTATSRACVAPPST